MLVEPSPWVSTTLYFPPLPLNLSPCHSGGQLRHTSKLSFLGGPYPKSLRRDLTSKSALEPGGRSLFTDFRLQRVV